MWIIIVQFVVLPLWTLFLLVLLCCIVQTAFASMTRSHYSAKLTYEKMLRESFFGAKETPIEDVYPPKPEQYSTT